MYIKIRNGGDKWKLLKADIWNSRQAQNNSSPLFYIHHKYDSIFRDSWPVFIALHTMDWLYHRWRINSYFANLDFDAPMWKKKSEINPRNCRDT